MRQELGPHALGWVGTHTDIHTKTRHKQTQTHTYTQRHKDQTTHIHRDIETHHTHARTHTHPSPASTAGGQQQTPALESPAPALAPWVVCFCFAPARSHTHTVARLHTRMLQPSAWSAGSSLSAHPAPSLSARAWQADKGQEAHDDGEPSPCQTPGHAAPAPRGPFSNFLEPGNPLFKGNFQ